MRMPRKSRETSGTGIYHVMLRGINRQNIFYDTKDYEIFLELLRKQTHPEDERHRQLPPHCVVYAYCLMPNHVHLLLREKEETLASVMKSIGVAYAWHYNKRYQHLGPVFQDRFRSEPVNDDAYFFTLLRYIHQNPIKAGMVEEVDQFVWSSWREFERGAFICSTQPVVSRMPLEDLRALVFEPLPKTTVILDIDNDKRRKSDEDVCQFLIEEFGLRHVQDILLLSKERQKDAIRLVRDYGASIRQIERLTGISFSIISRVDM
jgi:REP element-mobilizing transposase RayT